MNELTDDNMERRHGRYYDFFKQYPQLKKYSFFTFCIKFFKTLAIDSNRYPYFQSLTVIVCAILCTKRISLHRNTPGVLPDPSSYIPYVNALERSKQSTPFHPNV